MAREDGEQQAMTAERLAAIRADLLNQETTTFGRHAFALLAEVERQRDELNALAEKLDAEADYGAGRVESLAKRCAGQRHRAHVAEAEVERLQQIIAVLERRAEATGNDMMNQCAAWMASETDLLSDNERLRAREAALLAVVRQVARPPEGVELVPVYVTPEAYQQARALLASAEPAQTVDGE